MPPKPILKQPLKTVGFAEDVPASPSSPSPSSPASPPAQPAPAQAHKTIKRMNTLATSGISSAVTAATAAGQGTLQMATNLTKSVLRSVSLNREKCKAMLLDTTFQVRHQVLINFRDLIKSTWTEDPHVPRWLARNISVLIDALWKDIEDEIERDIEAAILTQQANAGMRGPSSNWLPTTAYLRFRSFILYHYLPCNKSFWGKIKDPIYLTIFFSMLAPLSVLHFSICLGLLLLLLFPGPPDEFQLLNFIMLFKGLQFVSGGVLKCVKTSLIDFLCYSIEQEHLLYCINNYGPPGSTPLDLLLDYVGTIVLTWFAASMLETSKSSSPRRNDSKRRGGRVWQLLKYDFVCFLISLALLTILTFFLCDRLSLGTLLRDPQLSSNIFWCSVLWSLSTLPFLPLNISFLFTALSRSTATGFNNLGACVSFEISLDHEDEKLFEGLSGRVGAMLRSIKDLGHNKSQEPEKRVEDDRCGQAVGDFTAGLYEAVTNTSFDSNVECVSSAPLMMTVWDRY
mmetsp:Transcript_65464/g.151963  ORF Transcript_65464/g.151963 Transcript_65464/m.151963 type:complete len:512 (+) Transcript_65464:102-1637(+)